MNRISKVFLLLLVFIAIGINNKADNLQLNKTSKNKELNCKTILMNDAVVDSIFNVSVFRLDTTALKGIFKVKPEIKIRFIKGYDDKHYKTLIFKTKNTLVEFFLNKNEGFYIEKAVIKADEIKLYKNCFIGMSKTDFLKKMSINKNTCDTIQYKDEDQTTEVNFIFKSKVLAEVLINTYE
jgi:hypothetical protein